MHMSAIRARFCADIALLCHLPHEVVMVDAVPSGWAVYMSPLWCDECVGSVWGHKQIWKSQRFTRQKILVLIWLYKPIMQLV